MVRQPLLTTSAVTLLALLASVPAQAASTYRGEGQWQRHSSYERDYDASRTRDSARRSDDADDGWRDRSGRSSDTRYANRDAHRDASKRGRWYRDDDRWDGRRHYRARWHHHHRPHGHWWRRWWWYD